MSYCAHILKQHIRIDTAEALGLRESATVDFPRDPPFLRYAPYEMGQRSGEMIAVIFSQAETYIQLRSAVSVKQCASEELDRAYRFSTEADNQAAINKLLVASSQGTKNYTQFLIMSEKKRIKLNGTTVNNK